MKPQYHPLGQWRPVNVSPLKVLVLRPKMLRLLLEVSDNIGPTMMGTQGPGKKKKKKTEVTL